jgi:hypothetical protein
MMDRKSEFLLLGQHTDEEITDFLQREAEAGWWLKENNGNKFIFVKKSYEGRRICSYVVSSPNLGSSAEDGFYDLLPELRKAGWNLVCLGKMENLADTRRHAFLCEMGASSANPVPRPRDEAKCNEEALRRGLLKGVSNLLFCVAYLIILVYALITKATFISKGISVVFGVVTGLLLCPSLVFSIGAVDSSLKAKKDLGGVIRSRRYRLIDKAVRLTFFMLVVLAVFLVFDFILS